MKTNNNKRTLKQSIVVIVSFIILILLAALANVPVAEYEYIVEPAKLQIIYFDVGQADSTLIMNNGETILIDAGNDADGEELVAYIKSQNISKIDIVIATHLHADHIGGLDEIIDSFSIGQLYMPDTMNNDKQVEELLDAMQRKKLKYEVPEIGTKFEVGFAECEVMSIDNNAKDLNNSSIVIQLDYNGQKYLFMGDSEKEVEDAREWNDVDVLKVGHHGSSSSSCQEFLNQIKPEIAIISVGLNNQYDHPSLDVLNRLREFNSVIYRTDRDGSLLLESDGEEILVKKIKTKN